MIINGEEYIFEKAPEHHCNDLPNYIDIFLDVFRYRWVLIDTKNHYISYIQFCPYCGKKLKINFHKNPEKYMKKIF